MGGIYLLTDHRNDRLYVGQAGAEGKGGGFWEGLAFHKKEAIVEKVEQDEADAKLAKLNNEQSRLLGESDDVLGDNEEVVPIDIPEADRKIVTSDDGTMIIPAVSCTSPKNNTEKILFLNSWGGGMQLHYQRLGQRPEVIRYTVEVPKAGKYEISLNVCTVSKKYEVISRLNRRNIVNVSLPFTKGEWVYTKPQEIELKEGRNSIQFTFRAPNRGVSFKNFKLKPVK